MTEQINIFSSKLSTFYARYAIQLIFEAYQRIQNAAIDNEQADNFLSLITSTDFRNVDIAVSYLSSELSIKYIQYLVSWFNSRYLHHTHLIQTFKTKVKFGVSHKTDGYIEFEIPSNNNTKSTERIFKELFSKSQYLYQ